MGDFGSLDLFDTTAARDTDCVNVIVERSLSSRPILILDGVRLRHQTRFNKTNEWWLAVNPWLNVSAKTAASGKRPVVQALPFLRDMLAMTVGQLIWKGLRVFHE